MTPEQEAHEELADQLVGLIRDVVMLHRPDVFGDCCGCDPTEGAGLCIPWPCATVRLVQEGMGL